MTEQHTAVPSDLTSLIERVEKATGPDRELDADIDVATFRTVMTDDDLIYARKRDPGEDATHPGHYFIKSRSGAQAVIAPAYTASIDAVLTLLPEGFWWRGGTCSVSSEATVCPDHNGPHRERLLRECPPTELIWDEGIETELRPGSNNALIRALLSAILRARQTEGR